MNNFVGHIEQRATALQAQLQQLETQVGLVTTQDARITVDDKVLGIRGGQGVFQNTILSQHFGHGLLQRFVLLTQFGDFTRGGLPLRISGQSFLFSLKKLLVPSVLPLRRPSTTARAPCWDRRSPPLSHTNRPPSPPPAGR